LMMEVDGVRDAGALSLQRSSLGPHRARAQRETERRGRMGDPTGWLHSGAQVTLQLVTTGIADKIGVKEKKQRRRAVESGWVLHGQTERAVRHGRDCAAGREG
jgi:hypothetical protein